MPLGATANRVKQFIRLEGLGQVIKVGKNVIDTVVGDYVATRGEPAYADKYNNNPFNIDNPYSNEQEDISWLL
mgnify:CR=1 FL=1